MKTIRFKTSGNIGDSIYALSFIYEAYILNDYCDVELYFHLNQPSTYKEGEHPVGNVMLNETIYNLAKPLFESQDYIKKVDVYEGQEIDYDLDLFRTNNANLSAGDIKLWHCTVYPEIRPQTNRKVLFVDPIQNEWVIFNRTLRYNNPKIDYMILPENTKFVGVEREYKIIKSYRPDIEHLVINDFLELAQYIAGCKVFIGNQSSPFAIAEQLKSPRILEQYFGCPNVIPQGGQWNIFHNQKQFEQQLKQYL